MPRVTMKDIAKRAGISQQAVSQIINKKDTMVSQATREKVMQLVKELNYQPNYIARSLRSGKRFCIGVAGTGSLSQMDDITTAQVFAGIGGVVEKHDHHMMMLPLGKTDLLDILIKTGTSGMVDGLIIMVYSGFLETFSGTIAQELKNANIPFVAVHSTGYPLDCPNVGFDAVRAGRLATEHLIDQGYTDIGIVCTLGRMYGNQVYEGYAAVMQEKNLAVHDHRMEHDTYSADSGYRRGQELLEKGAVRNAYVIHSDSVAFGFIRALEEAGKKVPEDVAVVGGDDWVRDDYLYTNLTAVNRRFRDRGRAAAEMLFRVIDDPNNNTNEQVILEPTLTVRDSSRKQGG